MTTESEQITKNPVCPVCRKEQLTNEELVKGTDPKNKRCWFCLVEVLVAMGSDASVPDPTEYGRPNITKEEGILLAKQKYFRATPTDMMETLTNAPAPTGAEPVAIVTKTPAHAQKPILQTDKIASFTEGDFTEEERKKFAIDFGMDPVPEHKQYEIAVHGTNDSTYLKYGCAVPADLAEEREMRRIMGTVLDIFGKLQKYGPQFAATLIELLHTEGEMFLGGRGK